MQRIKQPIARWIIVMVLLLTGQSWMLPQVWAMDEDRDESTPSLPAIHEDVSEQGAEALQESMREGLMSRPLQAAFPGPVDPDTYFVGVGDQFVLHFWGERNETIPLVVSPEGFLFIPNIGAICVVDMPLSQAKAEVAGKVRRIYRNLSFELFLQAPRRFQVQVVGLVNKPGVYIATPLTRVDEIIRQAGGFFTFGSERRIEIHRGTEQLRFADLVRWRRTGEKAANPTLRDGDTVIVPRIKRLIRLKGTTVKRGAYELLEGEDLYDLIFFLGMGLTAETSLQDESYVVRIGEDERRKIIPFDLRRLRDDRNYASELPLSDGDIVSIPSIAILQNVVVVRGAIFGQGQLSLETRRRSESLETFYETSGVFELREGETVYDIIQKTGGVTPWADLHNCTIERMGADTASPQIIKINLAKMMIERDFSDNVPMRPGDILHIPSKIDRVFIIGEVSQRGAQEYLANHPAQEYIGRAGGPTARAALNRAKVVRRNGEELDYDPQMIIQPGDTILVPETRMKWWQDYWTIIIGAATLALTGITAYNSTR